MQQLVILRSKDDSPGQQECRLKRSQDKIIVGRSKNLETDADGWRIEQRSDLPDNAVAKVGLYAKFASVAQAGWYMFFALKADNYCCRTGVS